MKEMVFLFAIAITLPIFADVLPRPGVWDIPMHRIGLEIVLTTIASAVGGGTVMRLLLKRGWKKSDELTSAEREGFTKRIDAVVPIIDEEVRSLCEQSGCGILELESPSQYYGCSNSLNRVKAAVLSEILLKNESLRKSLEGVPMELVCERIQLPKEILEDSMWPNDPYLCSNEDESQFEEEARKNYVSPSSNIVQELIRQDRNRIKVRRSVHRTAFLVIYLSGVIAMASGAVDVEASCVTARVFKVVFYPLLLLVGCLVFMFVSWIAWGTFNRWYREKKLKRISERRGKLLEEYRSERKWRIPVSDITLSRQQMQLSPNGGVIRIIGSATDASLRLMCPGVARHHAEIYFDKAYHALGGDGFAMRSLGRPWIGEYVEGQLPKKEKIVYLTVGREICVGSYAILKVVSVPGDKDNAFVFELVDGKRHEEKIAKMPQSDVSTSHQVTSAATSFPHPDDKLKQTHVDSVGCGIVLGRSRSSDVLLFEQDTSARHMEIVGNEDGFSAVCISRQGLTFNGKELQMSERCALHEGDEIKIGMRTTVRIVRIPNTKDDVMVLSVQDCRGTREEVVRLPMVADASPEELSVRMADCCVMRKPVIYLYPEKETPCSAKVITDGALTCTYPAHGADGWCDFVAAPDGTLTFPDGRKFYCLYWEGTTPARWDFSKGYCVKGADTAAFLADVLAKIGLSFREANEFIIYWLPRMQENPYNVIAFLGENYTHSAKLEIKPRPDSILRVFMAWKASDCPVDISAPDITPFERKGFTVVEWGGTEVEDEIIS